MKKVIVLVMSLVMTANVFGAAYTPEKKQVTFNRDLIKKNNDLRDKQVLASPEVKQALLLNGNNMNHPDVIKAKLDADFRLTKEDLAQKFKASNLPEPEALQNVSAPVVTDPNLTNPVGNDSNNTTASGDQGADAEGNVPNPADQVPSKTNPVGNDSNNANSSSDQNVGSNGTQQDSKDDFSFLHQLSAAQKTVIGLGIIGVTAFVLEVIRAASSTQASADIKTLKAMIANKDLSIDEFNKSAQSFTGVSQENIIKMRSAVEKADLEEFERIAQSDVIPVLQRKHDQVTVSDRLRNGMRYRVEQMQSFGNAVVGKLKNWFEKTKSLFVESTTTGAQ